MSNVSIQLTANTANYVQRLKDAKTQTDRNLILMEKRIDGFARDVNNNFTSVSGAIDTMLGGLSKMKGGGYIAGALVLGGAFGSVASQIHQASVMLVQNENALKLAAQQAGVTVDELRALSGVTSTVGIDFAKFGDISKDVQDKLGDFITNGTGGFEDFFAVVGKGSKVTAASLQKMTSIDVLKTMVREMEDVGATSQQMINALESVGNDSSNLLPYLRNGAKGFDELKTRMDAINETPLLLEDTAKNVHVLDTAFQSMWESFGVLMTEKFSTMNELLADMAAEVNKTFNRQIIQEQGQKLNEEVKAGTHKVNSNDSLDVLNQKREALGTVATANSEDGRHAQGRALSDARMRLRNTYGGESSIKGREILKEIKEIEAANANGVVLDKFKVDNAALDNVISEYDAAIAAHKKTNVTEADVASATGAAKEILAAQLKEQAAANKAKETLDKAANDKKVKADKETANKQLQIAREKAREELAIAQAKLDTALTLEDQIQARYELDLLKAEQSYKDKEGLNQYHDNAVIQAEHDKHMQLAEIKNQHVMDDNAREIANLESSKAFWDQALEQERITDQEHRALMLQNEASYTAAKWNLTMSQLDAIDAALSGISGLAEQGSSEYKALFAVEKAATIASLGLQMWDAWGNVDKQPEYSGSATATAIGKGLVIAQYGSAIASAGAAAIGQFHSGTDEVDQSGSYILQSGERIVQRKANQDLTSYLKSNEGGKGKVDVQAPLNIQGDTSISEAKLMSMMAKQRDQITKLVKLSQRENPSLR